MRKYKKNNNSKEKNMRKTKFERHCVIVSVNMKGKTRNQMCAHSVAEVMFLTKFWIVDDPGSAYFGRNLL